MLILQRKKDQSLMIGDHVRITVTEIGSDWVKLAVDAPRDVSILRSELAEAAAVNQESKNSLEGRAFQDIQKLWKEKMAPDTRQEK